VPKKASDKGATHKEPKSHVSWVSLSASGDHKYAERQAANILQ
jgi:hypothetical protein